jgi:hypothetical protein
MEFASSRVEAPHRCPAVPASRVGRLPTKSLPLFLRIMASVVFEAVVHVARIVGPVERQCSTLHRAAAVDVWEFCYESSFVVLETDGSHGHR